MKTVVVLVVLSISHVALAQVSTKIYSIANPNGSQTSLRSIWVGDTNNFHIQPLAALPQAIGGTGTIDFQVSITAQDGLMRTTQVYYQTDQGVSSYTISMAAPLATSGVDFSSTPPHDKHAYPNPANDQCTIDIDVRLYPNAEVTLVNEAGLRVIGIAQPRADKLILDTHTLAAGKYLVLVSSGGLAVHKEEIVVRH